MVEKFIFDICPSANFKLSEISFIPRRRAKIAIEKKISFFSSIWIYLNFD